MNVNIEANVHYLPDPQANDVTDRNYRKLSSVLETTLERLRDMQYEILIREKRIMTALSDLQASVAALRSAQEDASTRVTADLKALHDQVSDAQAKLAADASPAQVADVIAQLDEVKAGMQAIDPAPAPVAATPAETAAPETPAAPSDGSTGVL
ncbi:MAG: hypothetical protein ACR2KM_06650 [Gemmatimonadaceae bacterium]